MKIAIVKLSALGDIAHAMTALQFIHHCRPDIQIDWLVEENFAGVLQDNPHIQNILTVNLKAVKTDKKRLFQEIAKVNRYATHAYDLVIDAQGLLKSAIAARLLSANCAGFDRHSIREAAAACFYRHRVNCSYAANTIDRNVKILTEPLGISVSQRQILQKQPFLFYQPPAAPLADYFSTTSANVLFVIGSTWASRNYPQENFLQVIKALPVNSVICWGNAKELATAQWLAKASNAKVLPKLNLNDLKAAIDQADLVIGNDTGPTHMAWAMNRASITLFGPTPISRVYQTPINLVLKSDSLVNPYKLNKNDFSIKDIDPAQVIALATELLSHRLER